MRALNGHCRTPHRRHAGLVLAALLALCACGRSGPKAPGEEAFGAASSEILAYKGQETFGNDAEARQLAERFSRLLATMRKIGFTKGKEGALSLSEGHFLTYCERRRDSVLFLVHVPELRRFTKEARDTLLDIAWMCARQATAELRAERDLRLGVGLKGALLYGGLAVGPAAAEDPETKQAGAGEVDQKLFYPFFTGTPAPARASAEAGEGTPLADAAATAGADPASGTTSATASRPSIPGVFALRSRKPGLAFSVAEGVLATASDRLSPDEGTVSLEGAGGETLSARVVSRDDRLGLALLAPQGTAPLPLPIASPAGLKAGDGLQGVAIPVTQFRGLRVDSGAMVLDTEITPEGLAVGGPLMNAQSQVVGIAVVRPGRRAAEFLAIDHVTDFIRFQQKVLAPPR